MRRRPRAPGSGGAATSPSAAIDFTKNGRVTVPFSVLVDGKPTPAKLVGTLLTSDNNVDATPARYLRAPRVEIGGKKYVVSDAALAELLKRACGYAPEHGFSSQTRVFSGGWGQGSDAVNFASGQFSLKKGVGSYHDELVCVTGPGLPRVQS